jgi:hypothetical protein
MQAIAVLQHCEGLIRINEAAPEGEPYCINVVFPQSGADRRTPHFREDVFFAIRNVAHSRGRCYLWHIAILSARFAQQRGRAFSLPGTGQFG